MSFDPSCPPVAPADYDRMKDAVRLSAQFTAAVRRAAAGAGREGALLNAMTQDESADAQYIAWEMLHLPRRTPAERATRNFFQLALYDIFAEAAERAKIQNLKDYIPREMATRDMVRFLIRQERFFLALITLEAAP